MPAVSFLAANGWQTTIEDHRQLTRATFGSGSGLLTTGDLAPSPVVGELAIAIAPGYLVMEGDDHAAQGSYLFWEHETVNVPAVAPGVTARVDSILAVVADEQYGSLAGTPGARYVWATGTPDASPVALSDSEINANWAEPGAWYRIADIRVDPGVTEFDTGDITPTATALVRAKLGEVVYQTYPSVAQSIPNDAITALVFTAPTINKVGGWNASQTTRFTPTIPGYYKIEANSSFVASNAGVRYAELQKNGGVIQGSADTVAPTLGITTVLSVRTVVYLNGTTDYIQCGVYQTSGGSLSTVVSSTTYKPCLTAQYVGT